MNERFRFDGQKLRDWFAREGLRHAYLSRRLGCSESYVDKMLAGRVPSEKKLTKVAELMGVEVDELLLPRETRRTA